MPYVNPKAVSYSPTHFLRYLSAFCDEVVEIRARSPKVWISRKATGGDEEVVSPGGEMEKRTTERCHPCKYRLFREAGGSCEKLEFIRGDY